MIKGNLCREHYRPALPSMYTRLLRFKAFQRENIYGSYHCAEMKRLNYIFLFLWTPKMVKTKLPCFQLMQFIKSHRLRFFYLHWRCRNILYYCDYRLLQQQRLISRIGDTHLEILFQKTRQSEKVLYKNPIFHRLFCI